MPRKTLTPTPTPARHVVEALIIHHLNPLLQGRQGCHERIDRFKAEGDNEAAALEEASLLFLERAYSDGMKLLRQAVNLGSGGEAVQ